MKAILVALTSLALLFSLVQCTSGPRELRPVILVVVDTLRADHLGAYGYSRPTSPELDDWVASGRLYERAYATSPWTLPSFGSLYTGRLPSEHAAGTVRLVNGQKPFLPSGKDGFSKLRAGVFTVAEHLDRAGFATAAVINNAFLDPSFGIHRGFQIYDYSAATARRLRRAGPSIDRALAWLDRHVEDRFFLVIHLFDPHMNYDPPPPYRGRFTRQYRSRLTLPFALFREVRFGGIKLDEVDHLFITAAYDEELLYVDRELGRLRRALEARGFLEHGTLILTSDHGEEFFDHGGFEHGHSLMQELLHVPLVIWGRGVEVGRELAPVSLADVAPTILDAAGLELPSGLAGISLWPNAREGTPLPSRTLYASTTLYGPRRMAAIRWPVKVTRVVEQPRQFAVALDEDPGERSPRSRGFSALEEQLLADLSERLIVSEERSDRVQATLESQLAEDLRALGYIE